MESLGDRRRNQLMRLISGLEQRDTPELLVACLVAQRAEAGDPSDRLRIDDTMGAAWALDRASRYLERLRSLNEERISLNRSIASRQRLGAPNPWAQSKRPRVDPEAGRLAGEVEVIANLYCICVLHIRSLLMIASESLDVPTSERDLKFLDEVRPLRHHFEHWYNRMPGKSNQRELVTRTVTGNTYTLRGGLELDEDGRYVIKEFKKGQELTHLVDLRNHYFKRVEQIFIDVDTRLRKMAVDQLTAFVVENPGLPIPTAASIKTDGLFRAGGIE